MIYRILQDRNYQSFSINDEDASAKLGEDTVFHLDRSPKPYATKWKPIKIDFFSDSPKALKPDICAENGRLYLNEEAYEKVRVMLELFGECLPVEGGGYLFNCLATAEGVNGLDRKNSIDDPYTGKSFISFHNKKVASLAIFRTAFDSFHGLFCNEAFKLAIESSDLKGVVFGQDLGNCAPPDDSAAQPLKH